jgi:hypothetical protein
MSGFLVLLQHPNSFMLWMRLQVCVLSIITSILFFALPLAGRCHDCDTENPQHCVKGKPCAYPAAPAARDRINNCCQSLKSKLDSSAGD